MPPRKQLACPPESTDLPEFGQIDNSTAGRETIRLVSRDGVQSRRAQALLVRATGCDPERAAWALRSAAEHFEIDAEGAATWFLRWMSIDEEYAEGLLVRIAGGELSPSRRSVAANRRRAPSSRTLSPVRSRPAVVVSSLGSRQGIDSA
jgi:hypothetical protein